MKEVLQGLLDDIIKFGWDLLWAIIILVVGFYIVKIVMTKVKKGKGFNKLEKSSQTFLSSIISMGLKIVIVIMAVTTLGISMASIIAIIGSAGLALGLALQGGLSNIAGGVMIMIFKPFKVGDYIDTHADSGTVKDINIFHTVLTTVDNKTVVMPNGNLSNSVIVNYTAMKQRMLDLEVSVSYDSDIDKVKKVLYDLGSNFEYVLKDKDVFVGLKQHADSALIFAFRVWVDKNDYWTAKYKMLELIKKEFDKKKISIPFPQLDIHLDK